MQWTTQEALPNPQYDLPDLPRLNSPVEFNRASGAGMLFSDLWDSETPFKISIWGFWQYCLFPQMVSYNVSGLN